MSETKSSATRNLFVVIIIVAVIAGIYVLKMNAVNNLLGIGGTTPAAQTQHAPATTPPATPPAAPAQTPPAAPAQTPPATAPQTPPAATPQTPPAASKTPGKAG